MKFELTEEQKMIQEMVRDFARNEVDPGAEERDKSKEFPHDLVKKCADLGLMGVYIPEQYGGAGMDHTCYSIAVEELSWACAATGVIVSAHTSLACDPILTYGTDEQKEKFLTPLASGNKLGAFALTEPGAGTDAAAQKTTAVKDGDHYVLNGSKNFITNGAAAETAIVFAMTDKEAGHRGISAFILDTKTPGFSVGKIEQKMGISCSAAAEFIFEDCRIPAENILGEEGMGFKIAMGTLDGGRIGIASQAVGIAQRALDESVKYSKERCQFGKPISAFQAIQFKLANMATDVEAARLLTLKAAFASDQGGRYSTDSAMAKMFASLAAKKCSDEAVQIHGGYGYIKDYVVERLYRDAKITELYEGTTEVQRMVIAASLLKG